MATLRTIEPMDYLKQRLEAGSEFFIKHLRERNLWGSARDLDKNVIPVYLGEKTLIPHSANPAIRIVPASVSLGWDAMRVRREQYFFFIDCMTRTAESSVIDDFCATLAMTVMNWLLEFNELQPNIPNVPQNAYDAFVDTVQFGYSKGQVWRIARLSYWQKVQHAYVSPGISKC